MPTSETTYVLADLDVKEVSVVDRGANKRQLLVIKNAENAMPTKPEVPEAEATPAASPAPAQAVEQAAPDNDGLIVGIPEGVAKSLASAFGEMSQRLSALGEAVKAAPAGEGGVTDKFKGEVMTISSALRQLIGAEKSGKLGELLEKGGFMDSAYSVSKMPPTDMAPEYVMTEQGLMMKMPAEAMKQMACGYSMEKMYSAESALYDGDLLSCCVELYICLKALSPFIPSDSEMPQPMAMAMRLFSGEQPTVKQYATNQPQPSIAAGVPTAKHPESAPVPGMGSSEGDLAKAGRKLAGPKLDKLEGVLAQLASLVSELQPANVPASGEVAKADSAARDKLLQLARLAKAQADEIKMLRSARPVGNAGPVEGDNGQSSSGEVSWPDDLNDLDDSDL